MYYEQSLSQIVSEGSYVILFHVIAQTFSFSFIFSNNKSKPWCFIDGLNAKQKILLELLIPFIICLYILMLYSASKCCYHGKLVFPRGKRNINFGRIMIAMILLIVGNILSVLFKLLHCINITSSHSPPVHFYFAYEQCYGITWIISLICLIIIIASFSFIFTILRKMDPKERANKKNILSSFVSKYKPQFYYWEFIVLFRRIFIAMFSVYIDYPMFIFLFALTIICFIWIHNKCEPFIIQEANDLEEILLGCLVLIIVLQALSTMNNEVKSVIVSILIFLPFILAVYYIYTFIKKREYKYKSKESDDNNDESIEIKDSNEDISESDGDEIISEFIRRESRAETFEMDRLMNVNNDYQLMVLNESSKQIGN